MDKTDRQTDCFCFDVSQLYRKRNLCLCLCFSKSRSLSLCRPIRRTLDNPTNSVGSVLPFQLSTDEENGQPRLEQALSVSVFLSQSVSVCIRLSGCLYLSVSVCLSGWMAVSLCLYLPVCLVVWLPVEISSSLAPPIELSYNEYTDP